MAVTVTFTWSRARRLDMNTAAGAMSYNPSLTGISLHTIHTTASLPHTPLSTQTAPLLQPPTTAPAAHLNSLLLPKWYTGTMGVPDSTAMRTKPLRSMICTAAATAVDKSERQLRPLIIARQPSLLQHNPSQKCGCCLSQCTRAAAARLLPPFCCY